jgi:hypothetical protein
MIIIPFTAIYYMDFIHHPYVLQSQCFKGWLFPRHQVKPTLLGPVHQASLYQWRLARSTRANRVGFT